MKVTEPISIGTNNEGKKIFVKSLPTLLPIRKPLPRKLRKEWVGLTPTY
jgi:hypothetical protein